MNHLVFNRVEIEDKQRRKKPGYGKRITKDYGEHGNNIEFIINDKIKETLEKSEEFEFKPYLVLKVELEEEAQFTEEEETKLELFGLNIIDKESNTLQVVFSEDLNLINFRKELTSYKNGEVAKKRVKNEDLFSKIKTVSEWSKDDRLQFREEELKDQNYIDVYLWVFNSKNRSKEAMVEFERYVLDNGSVVCDSYIGSSVVMARVRLKTNIVDKIALHPLVYKIDLIRKLNISMSSISDIKNITLDEINFDNSELNPDTSASICVIDSGIYKHHPLFKGVIGDSRTFYLNKEVDDSSDDSSGHGTMVASICEYGDFEYNQEFKPQIYLHNAKIHNGQYENIINLWEKEVKSQIGEFCDETRDLLLKYDSEMIDFDEVINSFNDEQRPYVKMVYSKYANMYEKLIPTQMREIVEYFYNNYGCKIYNLSQGDIDKIYIGDKPKGWACVIDELQNEYDVLFVISSGNYVYNGCDVDSVLKEYPHYFYKGNDCKIIEPSNSALSITVGGLAITDKVYNTNERVNKLPISKRNELSSISRVGPGVLGAIKPDFIAYSGDIGLENNILGNKKFTNNIGLSKLGFNNNTNGLFTWDRGTSFAAPYIAHIAASILNRYPNISCNLLRAIIANSACIPKEIIENISISKGNMCNILKEFKHNGVNNEIKMKYYTCGYGFPEKDKCLESLENRVVLLSDVREELLNPDNMHIFEIPLPDEFKRLRGKKRVVVSLAFNPRVRNTRIDYIGTSMSFKLIKGKSIDDVINIYESQKGKGKANKAKIDNKYECKLEPGSNLRNNGTLQKGVFEFQQDINFNNQNLYLVVNCIKEWDNTPQKYAVVVTLESDDEEARIYNVIKDRIRSRVQDRVRV